MKHPRPDMKLEVSKMARTKLDELERAYRELNPQAAQIDIVELVLGWTKLRMTKPAIDAELGKLSDVARDATIEVSKSTHRALIQTAAVLAPAESLPRLLMAIVAVARKSDIR